jgi:4-hydroxybenzoate polyprenyltransferase
MIKELFNRFNNFSENTINKIENSKTPLYYFIFSFLFIIQLRNLLEHFSAGTRINFYAHIHFILFYCCLILTIILITRIFTKENIVKSFKSFSLFFPVILIGPLIDILHKGINNSNMSYFYPSNFKELLVMFFTFGGRYTGLGATIGMQIHILLILILILIYTLIKTNKNIKKSLLSSFFSYIIIFLYGSLAYFLERFFNLTYNDIAFSMIFFILFYIILLISFYIHKKDFFKIIFKDSRILRILYYFLMLILGIAIGYQNYDLLKYSIPDYLFLKIIISFLSILFAAFFSIITNNFVDYNIDKISNKERPLFNNNLSKRDYFFFGLISLVLSLISSFLLGYFGFFCIFLLIGSYFIYSMPPIRFKRIPIFSKLIISFNSLFLALLGFSFLLESSDVIYLTSFPTEYIIFFLLFTLAANFIDIKDYEGDKKEGIKTLPVLLGLEKSKKLIAFFFILPYLFIGLLNKDLMIICILLSLVNILLITDKNYNERRILINILFSILIYILSLLIYIPK